MPAYEDDINRKLSEISSAITTIQTQQAQIEALIEAKIDKILSEKLPAAKIGVSAEEYKRSHAPAMETLRREVRNRYEQFFNDNLRTLQQAQKRLVALKELASI